MAGSRVTRLAVVAALVVLAANLAISRQLTFIFDIGFVLVCVGAALAVHPRDFFSVGVLPPLLLLGLISLVAIVHSGWVAEAGDGFVQAVVSGLAHRATGLLAAYLLALGVLAIRQRVRVAPPAPRGLLEARDVARPDARHDRRARRRSRRRWWAPSRTHRSRSPRPASDPARP